MWIPQLLTVTPRRKSVYCNALVAGIRGYGLILPFNEIERMWEL